MNTFRKIKHNAKALSPVVASIILIAVTVAVSVAVAAWMGGMTLGFMSTEQVSITYVDFGDAPSTSLLVNVTNSGSSAVVITSAVVNGQSVDVTGAPVTVPGNTAQQTLTLTLTENWAAGYSYAIKLTSQKGNSFTYNVVAPQ